MIMTSLQLMLLHLLLLVFTTTTSAFSFQQQQSTTNSLKLNVAETAPRDVYALQEWASNCGVQKLEAGFELTSSDGGGQDWSVCTTVPIPAGTTVLCVPCNLVFSSETGTIAPSQAEAELPGDRVPLFRLVVQILQQTEEHESPYFPWLNSLPRLFYNGVAMTEACFECLPPYASWCSRQERENFALFVQVLQRGYPDVPPLSQATLQNDNLLQWAYNVALTRGMEDNEGILKIAPMADMLNHASKPNVVVGYDMSGNCLVTTTQEIPAGSPLTVSYADPTNPTPIFARYGFLYDDCNTLFCKAMHLQHEMETLGYDFKLCVFHTQTGNIAPFVWDLFLLNLMSTSGNTEEYQGFATACREDDFATKEQYHAHYFQYTLEALKQHVDAIITNVDELNARANSYDLNTHPRVPLIVAHNTLVKSTFLRVQSQLNTGENGPLL